MNKKLAHFSNKVARKAQKFVDGWAKQYWHDCPFGDEPLASKERYLELWEEAKKAPAPEVDSYEKESGFKLNKEWLDDLALHTQIVIKQSPLCYHHGRVLYSALCAYLSDSSGSVIILETGTARGFSSIVMARALNDQKRHGTIVTFDLLPHNKKMYWNCIDDAEEMKTRHELLSPWQNLAETIVFIESDSRIGLTRTVADRVHFAFLDGSHTYRDVMQEFVDVQSRQRSGDTIVFDDYSPEVFPGLVKAVDEGCDKFGYEKKVIHSTGKRGYVIAKKG